MNVNEMKSSLCYAQQTSLSDAAAATLVGR